MRILRKLSFAVNMDLDCCISNFEYGKSNVKQNKKDIQEI